MEMGSVSLGASGNNDALQGLKFGKRIYFGELGGGAPGAPVPSSATPMSALAPSSSGSTAFSVPASSAVGPKRGQPQPPRCQVEGCKADLTGAKAYYCRHKVCGMHSKSPKVIVAGLEQRFCQQCSRNCEGETKDSMHEYLRDYLEEFSATEEMTCSRECLES